MVLSIGEFLCFCLQFFSRGGSARLKGKHYRQDLVSVKLLPDVVNRLNIIQRYPRSAYRPGVLDLALPGSQRRTHVRSFLVPVESLELGE